ncbi:MAG: hypothetical protein RSP_20930 [Rhodanobacter sp.]
MKTLSKLLLTMILVIATMQAWAGVTQANDPNANGPCDSADSNSCGSAHGMPVYSFKSLLAGLNIRDTPIGYTPPVGPTVETTIAYNEREADQPVVFDTFNVGQKWTLNWISWIQDDPSNPGSQVLRYVSGGGGWPYSGYNATTGAFSPEPDNGAVLVMTSSNPVSYELRYADGSKDVFAMPDGATTYPRKVLLTRIVDAQGNALTLSYDNQHRLTTVTDAIGQQTTFTYGDSTAPLLVTGIADPFGRHATLTYDDQGRLVSITDAIGMTSTFTYDSALFVQAMTTPYGTTTFAHTEGANGNSTELSIQATDPDGHTERTEYLPAAPGMPFSVSQAPSGMNTFNAYLNYRASYYWDKNAFAAACTVSNGTTNCDYTKARMKHFLHAYPCCYFTSRVLENVKYPLEGMIWYDYAAQPAPYYPGTLNLPSDVGRVLDDGSSQVTHYTYNAYGKVTSKIDPDGRETTYTYAPNGIDQIQVQQKTANGFDTLASYTYNGQHQPLTMTDAAGGTTTYTYNARGQRTSVTDPLGNMTRYQYDSNGYLLSVIDALGHVSQRYTYDAEGRVATSTDAAGYTRQFQYDALNRVVSVSYPDHTSTRYTWNRLDLVAVTDRQGNTTHYGYDAERNLIAVTDPLGHVTQYTYYANGKRHTMTDPNGNVTTWTRDLEGRVTAKTYADGKGSTYAYDGAGRLISQTDALGQTMAYSYDLADLLTGVQYLHAVNPTAAASYRYDPYYSRLTGMTDGLGNTGFSYVPAGQPGALKLAQETGPFSANDSAQYAYDALGRVIRRTTDVTVSDTYDALGRLSEETNPLGSFQYSYLGDTDQLTWRVLMTPSGQPGLALNMEYESNRGDRQLRRLMYLDVKGQRLETLQEYAHSPEHLLTAAKLEWPRLREGRDHDGDGNHDDRADTIDAEQAVANDLQHDYGHDRDGWGHDDRDDGNNEDGRGDSERYRYDAAYRLTDVRGDDRDSSRFDYDAAGNLLKATGASFSLTASANALNQLSTVNGTSWQYDADGNLISDGVHQYTWDAAGRLVSQTNTATGEVTRYGYDGWGRRLMITHQNGAASTQARYLWCGSAVCQVRDGNDVVMATYFDQGEIHGARALYYVRDQLGSVVGATDANGKMLGTAKYGAYGVTTRARGIHPDYGYAGMLHDPGSSLFLTQYRAYDPAVGRWLSRDPIGEDGGENIYAYVDGDPLGSIDPLGLASSGQTCQAAWAAAGATCGGVLGGVLGGAGGAVGGGAACTLVAPGVGTVGCGVAGGESGGAAGAAGGAVAGGAVGNWLGGKMCNKADNSCPPCSPQVGTIGYRLDKVPPSKPHYPFPGDHVHLYRMNQNPNNCQCFWSAIGVTEPPPPPGAVPL